MREKKTERKKERIAHILKTKAKEREASQRSSNKSLKFHTLAPLDQSV